jgi:nucleotide-binding universal stress UspA family protein
MSDTPTSFPTALVMLAMDERDPALLEAVGRVADRLGVTRVLVAHVYRRDPFPSFLQDGLEDAESPPEAPEELERALDQLRAALPDRELVGLHAVGDPAEELARIIQQEDADILVIGRNATHDDGPGWGPSGLTLLRTAGVSALVIPLGSHLDFDRVVCGLDFSHTSTDALRVAAAIATELEVVSQYHDHHTGRAHTSQSFAERFKQNAQKHFEDNVLPLLPDGVTAHLEVLEGDKASQVLIDEAGNSTIVVGSRGLSKFAARLLGSTAERLAGHAHGPVLIVRKKGESLGLLEGMFHR